MEKKQTRRDFLKYSGTIKFTKEIPIQDGDAGYKINLRGRGWRQLNYPTG